MNKDMIEIIVKAIDKGFKADSAEYIGKVYSEAKKFLEESK